MVTVLLSLRLSMGVKGWHVRVHAMLLGTPNIAAVELMLLQIRASPVLTHNSSRLHVLQLIAMPMMMEPVRSLVLVLIMLLLSALPLPPGNKCTIYRYDHFFTKDTYFHFTFCIASPLAVMIS